MTHSPLLINRSDPRSGLPQSAATELALEALAAVRGIENYYVDACGTQQEILPQVRSKLLAATGVRVECADSVADEVERAQHEASNRTLPQSLVLCRARDRFEVGVVLPQDSAIIQWQVALESGQVVRGRTDFQALQLLESSGGAEGRLQRRILQLPEALPDGYHVLSVNAELESCHLIVSPGKCWLPASHEDGVRLRAISIELSQLRSADNWGVGDFTDLARLVAFAARHGVDVVRVNPLHLGPCPASSRLLLSAIFINVTAVQEFSGCAAATALMATPAFHRQLESCRASKLVDHAAVMHLKLAVLRLLYGHARADAASQSWQEFQTFVATREECVTRGCVFEVLQRSFGRTDPRRIDWRRWPDEFRYPHSEAVERFAIENAEDIQFQLWLQWVATGQLNAVENSARSMTIGLCRELAIGSDPAGAECWSNAESTLPGVRIGAPPSVSHGAGQDWGVAAFSGGGLHAQGYRSFAELLRATMGHAGAVHFNHVSALQHLWCIPEGSTAAEGAYISSPLREMLAVIALESQRHHCVVFAEDFASTPQKFRDRMSDAQILSNHVLHLASASGESRNPAGVNSMASAKQSCDCSGTGVAHVRFGSLRASPPGVSGLPHSW